MPGKEKRLLVLLFVLISFLFFHSHLDNNDLLVGAEYRRFKSVQISLDLPLQYLPPSYVMLD